MTAPRRALGCEAPSPAALVTPVLLLSSLLASLLAPLPACVGTPLQTEGPCGTGAGRRERTSPGCPEGLKGFESCCREPRVPQVNGSSAKQRRVPAPLSLNEGVTLSFCFSLGPALVLWSPGTGSKAENFPPGAGEEGRRGWLCCRNHKKRLTFRFGNFPVSRTSFLKPVQVSS